MYKDLFTSRQSMIESEYKQIESWTKDRFKKVVADLIRECLN